MAREQSLPDRAIGRSTKTPVDRAQHLARALMPLRRYAWIGRHALAEHAVPEPLDGGQSIRGQLVEHNEDAEGKGIIDLVEGDVEGFTPQSEPD